MKRILYILLFLPLLMACTNEVMTPVGEGELVVSDLRCKVAATSVVTTRSSVDPTLAVEILDADGHVYRGMSYEPGAVLPNRFSLIVGDYTFHAFTENATTWLTDNNGLGSAVYEGSQPFTIQPNWVSYVKMEVPMINYGVSYSVPANFSTWFPTCELTVTSGSRSCTLSAGQTAYFAPADNQGFTFQLHLVNTDGETYDLEQRTYDNPRGGLMFDIVYSFATDDDPTKLNIGISYDDTFVEIAHGITLY